ncbi:IS630 family transposase [Variovorax sp. WS11]|uniref:IS630 family transposase n=1 Tax=Variovorax sp. WS11 TaxID=1105204 RepID=UPI0013DA4591|nr:IS630 family transposase [Variovorax sp. WS11]NDZ14613.1 IS630 family transposase [Variovorax sp. WS11]
MAAQAAFKKLRRTVRQEVERQAERGRQVRLMFQDEGRFGLLGSPRRCWHLTAHARWSVRDWSASTSTPSAPSARTTACWTALVLPWVSAETMSLFLSEVAQRHAAEFIVMVMDQAGWHIAGDLAVPQNMRVIFLPPYSPELNPAEHLWESLREDCFANHVFANLDAVESTLTNGLVALESNPTRTHSMTGFKWITSISLNAS